MQLPHEMTTLSQVMELLKSKGLDREFKWTKQGFLLQDGRAYQPVELKIVKVYRFEGMTDPADMSILYIIQTNDGQTGYSLNAYGVYNSHDGEEGYDNFIRQVPESCHEEQLLFTI